MAEMNATICWISYENVSNVTHSTHLNRLDTFSQRGVIRCTKVRRNVIEEPPLYRNNLTDSRSAPDEFSYVWTYVSPVILMLGCLGNLLTFIVMRRRRLRNTTTSVYLSIMSLADTLALISRIGPEFFKSIRLFTFSDLHGWTCKVEKFTFYTSSDVAIWLLVAFTFDRLIAVCFPLHKRSVCVPRKACWAAAVIATLAILKNGHIFLSRDVTASTSHRCGWVAPFLYFEEFVRGWIAFTLVSAIPFLFILICNCFIIRTLTFVERLASAPSIYISNSNRKNSSFAQTSWMCLSVSLTFLACVTPSIILSIGRAYWSEGPHKYAYNLARAINNQLACVNHAINFFLYCLTGQRFRSELVRLFNPGTDSIPHVAVTGLADPVGSITGLAGWTISDTSPRSRRRASESPLSLRQVQSGSAQSHSRSPRVSPRHLLAVHK